MQKLLSRVRAAVQDYDMISDGDRIAVGVSGGKDSLVLLASLSALRRFYPKKFDLVAITLDMQIMNEPGNFDEIRSYCESIGIPYIVKQTELYNVIFNIRKEKNPCSLCAKMRRGILHDCCKELGCNKLALGHHSDDAAETFMMNLLRGGHIGCFSPVSYLSRKDMYVIRPLIYCTETQISAVAENLALPVMESSCPEDGNSERQSTKELLAGLEQDYPGLREKIITAMKNKSIDKW